VRLLLDSQAVLLTMTAQSRIPRKASAAIGDPRNVVFVSAATPYELEWKRAIGKLRFRHVADWSQTLQDSGYQELQISVQHSHRAALLPRHHRDPWDRLLVAQALTEDLTLVTGDANIAAYGVPTLW
jgi:PIN domain nuclease of toxin-antitoxin system